MKKFHPFYSIGTLGIVVIACLHMFLALGLALRSIHSTFYALYAVFLTFLILGVIFTVKNVNTSF
ncbi:hypothetical protein ES711_11230 [Gelidibacter salicanalis]|uniref:Uncharacterized protein n=1 Tax=Gelidibacter salicanalis TaxID=291193 RepID=A0A5C7AL82_9FLAO|nr:hypothetical protein [Gelidibacter salicanalis]TXE07335.1 hypothetical protein ES711_11230 [Gelidibacter salicanalis]